MPMPPQATNQRAWVAGAVVLLLLVAWGVTRPGGSKDTLRRQAETFAACPRTDDWWHSLHTTLVAEVAAAEAGQGWDILFLGDSLIETMRGTTRGGPCARCQGVPEVLAQQLAHHRVGALGIAGDRTPHLLWRLRHGELPAAKPPKLVLLLLGTNDLGAVSDKGEAAVARAVEGTVQQLAAVVALLRGRLPPSTQIVLLGLLPRGTPTPADRYADPSSCGPDGTAVSGGGGKVKKKQGPPGFEQPSIFTAAIEATNRQLRSLAAAHERVHYVGCGAKLLLQNEGQRIDERLMPDALHPNAAGYRSLFEQCWKPEIQRLLAAGG